MFADEAEAIEASRAATANASGTPFISSQDCRAGLGGSQLQFVSFTNLSVDKMRGDNMPNPMAF